MSEAFFSRFLWFFLKSVFLILVTAIDGLLAVLYVTTQIRVFYILFLGFLIGGAIFFLAYYMDYRDFQNGLYLIVPPDPVKADPPLSIDVDNEENAVKSAFWYSQGATFVKITEDLGLTHVQQGQRLVRKGIVILLKEHKSRGLFERNRKEANVNG